MSFTEVLLQPIILIFIVHLCIKSVNAINKKVKERDDSLFAQRIISFNDWKNRFYRR